ncbi:alpha/beta fold hydrolase [Merismopedia glauca]|uniref:alpha/beta fold hydrolase n=1 Tax=Merismopedia glauca TaxID=292586 RepID=UPI0015E6C3BF|nr:alpha/beta fold hydrolase [Merismopedia glauca]
MVINQELETLNHWQKHNWLWQGHQIKYTVWGSGKPLVLVHGFGASIGHWRHNIPVLAEGGYQVFAVDLLGFGGSDKPILDYSLELWQNLLVDFWREHIQQPTVFVGNSIGALLSLMVVANHPEISAGGILINCAGGLNHRPDELNLPLRLVMQGFNKLVKSQLLGGFFFNQIRQKKRLRQTLLQVYRNPSAVTDELIEIIYTPTCDRNAQQVFAKITSAPAGPTPLELLSKVERSLLVLWGADDPWTPIAGGKIFQNLAESGKSVKFTEIPNAGHCPHDECPDIVNPLILDWLNVLQY